MTTRTQLLSDIRVAATPDARLRNAVAAARDAHVPWADIAREINAATGQFRTPNATRMAHGPNADSNRESTARRRARTPALPGVSTEEAAEILELDPSTVRARAKRIADSPDPVVIWASKGNRRVIRIRDPLALLTV